MKIIALGDTHGRDCWKRLIPNPNDADKIIFIGDYFDSLDVPFNKQMENFLEILEYKKANPNLVSLLFGNHDYHYYPGNETYSGYQWHYANQIRQVIKEAFLSGLFDMAYQAGALLFSHAGLSETWAKNFNISYDNPALDLNNLFHNDPSNFRWVHRSIQSGYGDNIYQSPIWIRPPSLMIDAIPDIKYVVGHTHTKGPIKEYGPITQIDCLDSIEEAFVFEG